MLNNEWVTTKKLLENSISYISNVNKSDCSVVKSYVPILYPIFIRSIFPVRKNTRETCSKRMAVLLLTGFELQHVTQNVTWKYILHLSVEILQIWFIANFKPVLIILYHTIVEQCLLFCIWKKKVIFFFIN